MIRVKVRVSETSCRLLTNTMANAVDVRMEAL